MTLRTSTASGGLASAGASWVGGVAPVDGDSIVVVAGATIQQDVNRIYGNKTTPVGHAVSVKATSSSVYGTFIPKAGVTITQRGYDTNYAAGGNTIAYIEQWARFTPEPGATILLDVATDGQSGFYNHGVLTSIGTDAANRVIWDVPAANKNWNNAHSYDTGSIQFDFYDLDRHVGCYALGSQCLSNAAGTDLGALGNSSLSFSSQSPAGILTTEVASIALVNGAGKYYVDYAGGLVWFYTTQTPGSSFRFVATAKKLTWLGAAIRSTDPTDGNQAIFRYSLIGCLGSNASAELAIVADAKNKTGTLRDFEVTHCLFRYGRGVQMRGVTGTAVLPIHCDDNEWIGQRDFEGYGAMVCFLNSPTAYVTVDRNKGRPNFHPFINSYSVPTHDHLAVRDNVALTPTFAVGDAASTGTTYPDLDASGNAMLGAGTALGSRQWGVIAGTLGHQSVTSGNLSWRAMRIMNYGPYQTIDDNVFGHNYHHTINSTYQNDDVWLPGLIARRNISARAAGGGFCELGYNTRSFTDGAEVSHNTIYRSTAWAALGFGDQFDDFGTQAMVGFALRSNLVVQADFAVRRIADTASNRSRVHLLAADHNGTFGSTTADFSGFSRFATFAGLTNVAGVSLFNPSFATPVSGKTLALVVTSETNRTLAWDGGTPVQLVKDSGTATAPMASDTYPSRGYLNDTTKAWSTNPTNAACQRGRWVKITGGTGVGQIRRITNNAATQLTVVPAWTTPIDATSTYAIVEAEVVLSNAGATATVNAGVDYRTLPTTSQTDAAIAVSFHGVTADPQLVDPERDVAKWDLSLGGPGTEDSAYARLFVDPTLTRTSLIPYLKAGFAPTNAALATAAHDGGTIGAMDYQPPPNALAGGAITLPSFTASGTGQSLARASGTAMLPHFTASGTAVSLARASGTLLLPRLVASGTGSSIGGLVSGSGTVTLPRLTAHGTALSLDHPLILARGPTKVVLAPSRTSVTL
jgi:hypothetical protein